MRAYGALSPIDDIPQPPDIKQTMLIANSSGQAMDWPNSTGGPAANAASVGAHLVRFTGFSMAGIPLNFFVSLTSTHAAVPTTGTAFTTGTTAGSTGIAVPVLGVRTLQIPAWSTGWSVASLSSGYVTAEIWRK